jgi:hypothetical protein
MSIPIELNFCELDEAFGVMVEETEVSYTTWLPRASPWYTQPGVEPALTEPGTAR